MIKTSYCKISQKISEEYKIEFTGFLSKGGIPQRPKIEPNTNGKKVNEMSPNDILLYS